MSLMTVNPNIDIASEQQPSIYYLDDGTAIFKVVTDPNGLIIANAGSLALQNNGDAWIKSGNNDAVWTLIGGGGGTLPGAPDNSVQYNDGAGGFAGNAGFIYDPSALTNLLLEPQISNGLAIFENGTTPPASAWSPFLLQLHSGNRAFSMVFTNEADSYQWSIYRNGFDLNIESTGPGRGFLSWYLQPEAASGYHYTFPNGYLFSSVSATYYGGIGEIASDKFALMLSTGTVSAGTRFYPLTFTRNLVGINQTTPLASFHVNAANNTSVAGLFIANAPTVDVLQVSIDNGVSAAFGIDLNGFSYARKGAIIGGETSAAELRFLEPSASGSNYTGFKAPVLAGNIIYTLPDTAGSPGDALIINASNVLSWNATSGFGQSPGLPDTSIQFNNAGVFDGDATFFFDDANKTVNAGSLEITQSDINISGFTLNINAGTLVEPFVIKDSGGNIRGGWSFAGAFFYRGFTSAPTNSLADDGKLFYDITGGVTDQQLLLSKNTGTYNPVIVANQASYVTKRLGVWSSADWELADTPGFEYQSGASPNVRILAQNDAHSALLLSSNSGTVSAPILDVRVNLVADTGLEVDGDNTAGNTRLLIYDVDNATLERVSVGAADSGGTGFKLLRIPN